MLTTSIGFVILALALAVIAYCQSEARKNRREKAEWEALMAELEKYDDDNWN